jgi:hypothetical protein
MENIDRRVRVLETYAIVSLLVFGALAVSALRQTKQSFDEISVGRLNVVEKDGQLRAVIANSDRMPDPIVAGKAFKTQRPPGMIFYNGLGDEDGGLIFGAVTGGGQYGAYAGLSLDQYQQSQAIGLIYNDHSGSREVGLSVWDRPETTITTLMARRQAIEAMPDGSEKEAAKKSQSEAEFSPTRVFVGKDKDRDAKVTLYDAKGNARINMVVDSTGLPRLDFLNENGKVIYSLPNSAK